MYSVAQKLKLNDMMTSTVYKIHQDHVAAQSGAQFKRQQHWELNLYSLSIKSFISSFCRALQGRHCRQSPCCDFCVNHHSTETTSQKKVIMISIIISCCQGYKHVIKSLPVTRQVRGHRDMNHKEHERPSCLVTLLLHTQPCTCTLTICNEFQSSCILSIKLVVQKPMSARVNPVLHVNDKPTYKC